MISTDQMHIHHMKVKPVTDLSLANTEAPALWWRVGSHGTRNLTKGSNYKIKFFKKWGKWQLTGWAGTRLGPPASVCGPGPTLYPGPPLPFLVKNSNRFDVKNQANKWGWEGKRKHSFLVLQLKTD